MGKAFLPLYGDKTAAEIQKEIQKREEQISKLSDEIAQLEVLLFIK